MMDINSRKELLNWAKAHDNIVIYGNSVGAERVCGFLEVNDVKPKCFVISDDRSENRLFSLKGYPTVYLKDLPAYSNMGVIVSTKAIYHKEIEACIKAYNLENVVFCAESLLKELHVYKANRRIREKMIFSVHLTEHCNLNCRGCYHFSSIAQEEYLDTKCYESDIKRLSELLDGEMQEIMLMGGEPLLHPQINDFMLITRKYFPVGKIKILTNGILLSKMDKSFWNACQQSNTEIWATKYPINLDYEEAERIANENGFKIQYFNKEPVRTLGHQPIDISGKYDYVTNFTSCYRANLCIMLDHGRLFTCLVPANVRHFNQYFGTSLDICEKDYIDIYKVKSKEEIFKRLLEPTPFCRYCDRRNVSMFEVIPWEVTKHKMEEWTN